MADNLCGPSAPTKGLVNHLNRDRNLQQDRVVNAPVAAGSSSTFRSNTETPANMAAGDAAFAAFSATSTQPQAPITNAHRMLPRGPAIHGGFNGAPQANTSWVRDFERMQLEAGGYAAPIVNTAGPLHQSPATHLPQMTQATSAPTFAHMGSGGQMMMAPNVGPLGPPGLIPGSLPGFQHNQPAGTPTEQFHQYPRSVVLAANTEEALEAAFAAYDDEFSAEMDQWVAQHGPTEEDHHEAAMQELADDLDARRESGDPRVLTQKDPENRAAVKAQEDHELRKYASEILVTMAEGNEKFKKSSFNDLMRRIVNREVVIQGNEIVDVATGEPADLTARDLTDEPLVEVPPTPAAIIPPTEEEILLMNMAQSDVEREEPEGKGKGKENEGSPAQHQGAAASSSSAST
ncbi:hypothetical protein VPNG_08997 [Cytospora leucostoma]|uniref:Peroxin 20 n=1 Tax=Cytospora leucostoma TaxID=1230097 RepID=A0A423VZW8_9PEZI|nr:hypothetical protein VPNG_08997 [Cytospora leucostoma]